MGVKISELPAASALAGTEPLPLVQATETRKATVADIAPVRSVAGKTGEVTLDPADCGAAAASHSHSGYEPALGNPASDGQVLASTAAGVRSWVDSASGGGSHNSLNGRDAAESHPASAIINIPAGNIVAVTVQAALNELDTEKAAASHTHVSADITDLASGGYPSNLISSPLTVPADTSYIVMGELRIESDFTNNGNVGIL